MILDAPQSESSVKKLSDANGICPGGAKCTAGVRKHKYESDR